MNTLSGNGLTIGQSLRPNYQMQIAGRDTKQPGGIPNRPYEAPKEDPNNPYVPAPKRDLANLTPKMFTPFDMNLRDDDDGIINHIITPSIRDSQMHHFKNFIKNTGESTWDLSQANSPMMIAKKKKKRNRELTIYEEAARRDFERDMGFTEEGYGYDPDEVGPLDDLLDGV
jgi:hypothetical protein